jgi:pyruvate dehydrogenase E2 component (dihydrolipoamide acetyltransferase)
MTTEVRVPPLGQTVDTVTLVAWHKKEGDTVAQGEMLFAIETDKATLDIEAPDSGVLQRIVAQPGDEIKVLSTIALITPADEVLGEHSLSLTPEPEPREAALASPSPAGTRLLGRQADRGGRIFVSPRAKRLADEYGIALTMLAATGPEGAIVERDVRAHLAARQPSASRTVVAQAAGVAATGVTAYVTFHREANATGLVNLRRRLLQDEVDVSYDTLLLYIVARALGDHPQINASLREDSITIREQIDIGLVLEGNRGQFIPVIRDVRRKGLRRLARESQALVQRALDGQCTHDELGGATFTVANLGPLGIDSFTPSVEPPSFAALGVGRITERDGPAGDQVRAGHWVWLSLTFDPQPVNGALAAHFLQRVAQLIEQPFHLLA